jgi:hypothetical protein
VSGVLVTVLSVVLFVVGALMAAATALSAVMTVVVPRGVPMRITRRVFVSMRKLFSLLTRRANSYEDRDRIMAAYGPLSLLVLAVVWLIAVGAGYGLMYWALGARGPRVAFALSGSSLFTLGFMPPHDLPATILSFSEATLGLGLLAMLISYLPSIYTAFSRREASVTALDVRAGSPPTAVAMLERYARIDGLGQLSDLWQLWETWFSDIEETHSSQPALVFFRSPHSKRSWITAAGAVLDAASISVSSVEGQHVEAQLCIRAGYLALRRIATFFGIPVDPDPEPTDPISVTRDEFEQVYDRLAEAGVPLKPDREQCWRDFAGWRVNYDSVLLSLAGLVMAPYAPWSSDRSISFRARSVMARRRSVRRSQV